MASGDATSPFVAILPREGSWRSRPVRYYAGDWASLQTVLPEFDLVPFTAGQDEPGNPFLRMVRRKPLLATERPIPIGVVSHTYALAPHREVAALCRQGLINADGIKPDDLRYEVGLSALDEWMHFRIYCPGIYSFTGIHETTLDLTLECFNAVDGWAKLVILFGWFRSVCSNGLVIGETKITIRERHGQRLDLAAIPTRIQSAFEAARADCARLKRWQAATVSIESISTWVNNAVSKQWGKKAAVRVFHICDAGTDVEITDPFASGPATEKPTRDLGRVPGAPERATTKYDVAQVLSFVATHRTNTEERVTWQAEIPNLLKGLPVSTTVRTP